MNVCSTSFKQRSNAFLLTFQNLQLSQLLLSMSRHMGKCENGTYANGIGRDRDYGDGIGNCIQMTVFI